MRQREAVLIAGLSGTGKTRLILQLIDESKHGKVLIYDRQKERAYDKYARIAVDMIPKQKSGIYKVQTNAWQEVITSVNRHVTKALIIFDDASGYTPKLEFQPMVDILIGKRHKMLDIVMVFHSLNRVPPYVLENITKLILFKTNDNIQNHVADKIPRPDAVKALFSEVEGSDDPHKFAVLDLKKPVIANP